jgi:hypothetical protein
VQAVLSRKRSLLSRIAFGAVFASAGLLAIACRKRSKEEASQFEPPEPAPPAATTFAIAADAEVEIEKPRSRVRIDVAIGGDAIPQVKVLANDIQQVVAGMPSCWGRADARVFNLEAPVGDRKGLPGVGDKTILAFAAPVDWLSKLHAATKATALVVANNHSCDLGPPGLADTLSETQKIAAPVAGASTDDPWKALDVVEKDGRHVCLVAWTTFLNDKGKKQQGCLEGVAPSFAKVARAELGRGGNDEVHKQLSAAHRWDGCDARIAYIHGGREYKPQIRPVLEQAEAAAAYVDAVIIAHPHVPDLVETIAANVPPSVTAAAGGRVLGRGVPVYRSLGNFISNQGIGWSLGMSVDLLSRDGVPDPIRTVWTRVSVIARLQFEWDPLAPLDAPPSAVKYGYTLAFSDRGGEGSLDIRLRPLPSGPDDKVAEKLRKGPKPFGLLLDSECRLDEGVDPTCDGLVLKADDGKQAKN